MGYGEQINTNHENVMDSIIQILETRNVIGGLIQIFDITNAIGKISKPGY